MLQAPAVGADARLAGEVLSTLGHLGGYRTAAVRRVYVQAVARVGLDQRHLPFRQLCLVLSDVAGIDRIQALVTGIRVAMARRPAGRRLGQAAAPCGYAAIGIPGLFGASGGKVGKCRDRNGGTEQRQQRAAQQGQGAWFHELFLAWFLWLSKGSSQQTEG
ncbi:hypothetical protein D3C78_1024620 [compost metagenome]